MKIMVRIMLNNEDARRNLHDNLRRLNIEFNPVGATSFVVKNIIGSKNNVAFTTDKNINVYVDNKDLDYYEIYIEEGK